MLTHSYANTSAIEPIRSQHYDPQLRKTVIWDRRLVERMPIHGNDPEWWAQNGGIVQLGAGRGGAWRIQSKALLSQAQLNKNLPAHDWVLRHYLRGGLMSKLSTDRYLGLDVEKTRAWLEWKVLAHCVALGLPVPKPVAAFVQKHGVKYSASIMMTALPDTQTFGEILRHHQIGLATWKAVGACIARFHLHGIYHADLNVDNVLLNSKGEVFLIDFDRAEIRKAPLLKEGRVYGRQWQKKNLSRLQRSMKKLAKKSSKAQAGLIYEFDRSCWDALTAEYALVVQRATQEAQQQAMQESA